VRSNARLSYAHSPLDGALDIDRFFGVALIAAVIYFVGQLLFLAVLVSETGNLQRAIYLLFFVIQLPATPLRLLFPSASPDVSLAVACLGWGAVFYLGGVLRRHLGARRPPTPSIQ
jgi:hypothetical protein